jgi:hypothetical protein
LKNFYELEKDRLERRIQEEKERASKRYNMLVEEYEQRLKDTEGQHEDDIMMMQEEIRENKMAQQQTVAQFEHENSLNQQKIETLEKYSKETKEALNKQQASSST